MRKLIQIINTICVLFAFQNFTGAQCVNEVSTDHTNPTNNSLPIDLVNTNGDVRFLNNFNIYPLTPGGSLEDYDLTNMYFAGVQLLEMDNIWSNQVIPYYNYISKQPIPISKNGWELLLLNVGRYPDDNTVNSSNESFQSIPYIVIYNRYSGIMRVFANFGLDQTVGNGPDAVEIILEHKENEKMSGILRLNEGVDRALDVNSKILVTKSIAKATNTQRQWFSADFQVAYDPCVCYYPSELQISFNQIKQGQIKLYGRGTSLVEDLISPQLKVNAKDYLTSFDNTTSVPAGGILYYKGMLPLIEDYIARLNAYKIKLNNVNRHNEIVEHNLGALKMLKYMLTIIVTQGIGGGDIGAFGAVENQEWYSTIMDRYGNFITTANGTFDEKKVLDILKKVIGGSTKTYIEQDFEKLPLPTAPSKPQSVTLTEMNFIGSIIDRQVKGGPSFYTPGTYGSEGTGSPIIPTMYNYPIYNEALGVIAFIESPKVIISDRKVAQETEIRHNSQLFIDCFNELYAFKYQSYTLTTQMKLQNEIKYVLNPALDIKSVDVKAAWNIKAREKVKFNNGITLWSTYLDPDYTVNVFSKYVDVNKFDGLTKFWNTPYTGNINEGWCVNPSSEQLISFDLETKYYDLKEFHPLEIGAGSKNEFILNDQWHYFNQTTDGFGISFDTIDLKLMVDVTFNTINSNGEYNKVTQLLTIPVDQSNIQYSTDHLNSNLNNSWDTAIIPDVLSFSNTNFDGSNINGCYLVNNHYICLSNDVIYIDGVLQTSSGYTVEMIAHNEILVQNNSDIIGEIILKIEKLTAATNQNYEVSQNYIRSYCKNEFANGPNYRANIAATKSTLGKEGVFNKGETEFIVENKEHSVILFPNPSDGTFSVKSNDDILNIFISDVFGREMNYASKWLSNSEFMIDVETKGMYLIQIRTGSGTSTKQIIIK